MSIAVVISIIMFAAIFQLALVKIYIDAKAGISRIYNDWFAPALQEEETEEDEVLQLVVDKEKP